MSRPNGAPVHRTLVAVCSTVVLVSGFAAGLHGQPAKPPVAIVDPATGSRALLYVDVVGTGANRRLVTAGVLPEGRQLGAVVFGLGATWSPEGTGFAFIDHQLALKFRACLGETDQGLEWRTFDIQFLCLTTTLSDGKKDGMRIMIGEITGIPERLRA